MAIQNLPPKMIGTTVGTTPAFGASPGLDASVLSPESMMAFLETNLRDLNNDIKTKLAAQRNGIEQKKELNALAQALRAYSNGVGSTEREKNEAQKNEDRTKIVGLLTQLDGFKESLRAKGVANADEKIEAIKALVNSDGNSILGADEIKQCINTVSEMQNDIDAENELSMIDLQSKMQRRQQILQLGTNIVQSLGQQLNIIAQNVGK